MSRSYPDTTAEKEDGATGVPDAGKTATKAKRREII